MEAGYTCLTGTTPSARLPEPLPHLVPFDPPSPDEYAGYLTDGVWPRGDAEKDALLPFVYGKRWRRWKGRAWESVAAWESGLAPLEGLAGDRKYHFVDVIDTPTGTLLAREDGLVFPLDDVFVYPVTRFGGVDLVAEPLAEGTVLGWVHGYDGAAERAEAEEGAPIIGTLPHHASLRLHGASPDGRWWAIEGEPTRWVATGDIRRVVPTPRPAGVGPDERWVDVDTDEQVLLLMEGDRPLFATLVSTGLPPNGTPKGLYSLLDKSIDWDMASLAGAAEPYHVERVPWVMHFRPRYALHGVFWHWGFGNRASHGCINLSPRDARRVFDFLTPVLPDGWHTVLASDTQPGMTVRVRAGTSEGPDRRAR